MKDTGLESLYSTNFGAPVVGFDPCCAYRRLAQGKNTTLTRPAQDPNDISWPPSPASECNHTPFGVFSLHFRQFS